MADTQELAERIMPGLLAEPSHMLLTQEKLLVQHQTHIPRSPGEDLYIPKRNRSVYANATISTINPDKEWFVSLINSSIKVDICRTISKDLSPINTGHSLLTVHCG